MAAGTRMKTMEENLKRLEAIVQQQHAINEQWVNSTNASLNNTNQLLEEQKKRLEDQDVRMEENRIRMEVVQLSTNQKVDDLAIRMSNWQQNNEQRFESLTSIVRNISRDREQELQGNSRRPQLNAESSARNTAPEGANLGSSSAEVNRGTSERSFHSGNVRFPKLDFPVFDGKKPWKELSEVRNCDEWEFHDLVGHWVLRIMNCSHYSLNGNVGSLDFEFMVINQPWVNAQEVFVKMSKKECADFELPSTVEDVLGSIDSIRSFVFDPGKRIEFEVQWMSVEVRNAVKWMSLDIEMNCSVFDLGGETDSMVFNVCLLACCCVGLQQWGIYATMGFMYWLADFDQGQVVLDGV